MCIRDRFLVALIPLKSADECELDEDPCCYCGALESQIKEQQSDLFADHTSNQLSRSKQLRLYLLSFMYPLASELKIRFVPYHPASNECSHWMGGLADSSWAQMGTQLELRTNDPHWMRRPESSRPEDPNHIRTQL